jgi:insertion element IS1 protein InsB
MLLSRPNCPNLGSSYLVKNGRIHNKKPTYKCLSCGRQFVENPTNKVMGSQTKDLMGRLLLGKISLAGIARSTGVSQKWLQDYVNNKYASIERTVKVKPKKKSDWMLNVMNYGHL